MPLESAQLLCTAINENGGTSPYKTTHKNHPSSIWTRECRENFLWLANHGLALCSVYTQVYGKVHKCEQIIRDVMIDDYLLPKGDFYPPPQCMPDQYKGDDTVLAYRKYMIAEKTYYAKWKNRERPVWWA